MSVSNKPVTSCPDWRVLMLLLALLGGGCGGIGQAADEGEPSGDVASTQDELRCAENGNWEGTLLGLLDPSPGTSAALAINEQRTVVGWSQQQISPDQIWVHAFRWKARTGMVDLGTLGGTYSQANDVNEREQVAGYAELSNERRRAVIWDAQNQILELDSVKGRSSFAMAINNRGQVVGIFESTPAQYRPFIWEARTGMVEIPVPTLSAVPADINDSGTVVGGLLDYYGFPVPFKWTQEEGVIALDLLGANAGEATSINDRGEIVGTVFDKNDREVRIPAKWTAHGAWRLPNAPERTRAFPKAINRWGLVVGEDSTSTQPAVALRWETSSPFARSPSVGPHDSTAHDVNDHGDIVGASTSGVSQATLWTRRPRRLW